MARRKLWDQLSPGYRRRLEHEGITPESHGTANLSAARGHSGLPRGRYPAPVDPTWRMLRNEATAQDRRLLERWWEKGHAPSWLQSRHLEYDVAAAISVQVFTPPERGWTDVQFSVGSDIMVVTSDDGSELDVQLPTDSWPDAWSWAQEQEDEDGNLLDVTVGS